ncbi:peroxiredoxin family protein [Terriglobus tenax]|uniref:peroxiredoxin family protein n=1 Tax=Terriglobus tenax TaxID=1111115 RepID=UPI0021DFBF2C|nr:peroxiredoxin family protein [Terriglobus tenax]
MTTSTIHSSLVRRTMGALLMLTGAVAISVSSALAQTPAVGSRVPDFTLNTPVGAPVRLSKELGRSMTTVLIILRGFPGYQCPYCQKQIHDLIEHDADFAAKKANVLLVYPGPPADLDKRAQEGLAKQANLPENISLVIDPDYTVTKLYGLRWDAPHETAYPSTFILDRTGKVLYKKISHSHGDRISAEEVLAKIP